MHLHYLINLLNIKYLNYVVFNYFNLVNLILRWDIKIFKVFNFQYLNLKSKYLLKFELFKKNFNHPLFG
jgi:hypothetical protein